MSASVAALGGKWTCWWPAPASPGPTRRAGLSGRAWRQVIDVNLNGLFYCNRRSCRTGRNGYGRIVNIASIAGKEGNPNASLIPRLRPA